MEVIEPADRMQRVCRRLAGQFGATIRLVPTMGSLHAGHASLIRRALEDKLAADELDSQTAAAAEANEHSLTSSSSSLAKQLNGSLGSPSKAGHADDAALAAVASDAGAAANDHDATARPPITKRPVIVVVSIFVNPLQFNDRDDFLRYPASVEQDLELCRQLGVHYVFKPKCREFVGDALDNGGAGSRKVSVISANGKSTMQKVNQQLAGPPGRGCVTTLRPPDGLATELEGKSRANHFEGMLTIVCKLLNIMQPSRAYFGEKDYQQLVLVDKMVRDLNMATRIWPVETVREPLTNLPLSSRNRRLNDDQRQAAANLMFGALLDSKQSLEDKCRRSIYDDSNVCPAPNFKLDTMLLSSLLAAQTCLSLSVDDEDAIRVDYLEIRCAKDLSVIEFDQALNLYDCQRGCVRTRTRGDPHDVGCQQDDKILEARLLIAIMIARVRLLDNMDVRLNL